MNNAMARPEDADEDLDARRAAQPAQATRFDQGDQDGEGASLFPAPSLPVLYRRHRDDVCRWAAALGGPGIDAADVAQDVFLVVHRHLHRYDGRDAAAWLYGITVRVTRAARRRAWFRRVLTGRSEALERLADRAPTPEAEAERRQHERTFYELVGAMSDKRRVVFTLFEVGGYSCEEIARLEGVPAVTVRSRLMEARREFIERARTLARREERRRTVGGRP